MLTLSQMNPWQNILFNSIPDKSNSISFKRLNNQIYFQSITFTFDPFS